MREPDSLHFESPKGGVGIARVLLERGADAMAWVMDGWTPVILHIARRSSGKSLASSPSTEQMPQHGHRMKLLGVLERGSAFLSLRGKELSAEVFTTLRVQNLKCIFLWTPMSENIGEQM